MRKIINDGAEASTQKSQARIQIIRVSSSAEPRMRLDKLRKTFSKFYRRHYELIPKYNVGLKTLLSEGLSEPEFYGDLVYKFKEGFFFSVQKNHYTLQTYRL